MEIKPNAELNANSEDPKKVSMLTIIAGDELKKKNGFLRRLACRDKEQNKERNTMKRFDVIAHSQKF